MNEQDFRRRCDLALTVAQGSIPTEFLLFCVERLNRGESVEEIWKAWNSR